MPIKIFCFDVETTGTDHWRHSIHQLSAGIYIDDVLQETIDLRIRPHEDSLIDPAALKISGVTLEEVQAYPHRTEQFNKLKVFLDKYVDIYNPQDKLHMLGFNNSGFDEKFIRNMWVLQDDSGFGAYFFNGALDVMILATQYLLPIRASMPSFKLHRVAKTLNIVVDEGRLHEAGYDAELTWAIYLKVRGRTIDDL